MEIVALTSFLAPFLPYVVQAGQKVAGKAADVIGDEAANYAEKLWERLKQSLRCGRGSSTGVGVCRDGARKDKKEVRNNMKRDQPYE